MWNVYYSDIHDEWKLLLTTKNYNLVLAFKEKGYKVERSNYE